MKQWKKNFGLAQRAMTLPPDTAGIDTREELAARRKCGKDGQEDAGRGESEDCPTWWPGRSSTRRRLELKMTRTGIGVVATRPIPAGGVVCQY
ncbi:unnamed protein product [Peronospora farinosa]|uniref:Uncharacterized protein n=1 Tax=Peronospora farinosa TaxID=134698 RepID=A0AAV0UTX1_9STRA|nr:unnamed protein product [Peronospora farinosa]